MHASFPIAVLVAAATLLECAIGEESDVKHTEIEFSKLENRDGVLFAPTTGAPFSGVAFANFKEGSQRFAEATFKDGKMHGRTRRWFPNGKLMESGFFDLGARIGKHEYYYSSGQRKSEVIFDQKKPDDPPKTTRWFRNGQQMTESDYIDLHFVARGDDFPKASCEIKGDLGRLDLGFTAELVISNPEDTIHLVNFDTNYFVEATLTNADGDAYQVVFREPEAKKGKPQKVDYKEFKKGDVRRIGLSPVKVVPIDRTTTPWKDASSAEYELDLYFVTRNRDYIFEGQWEGIIRPEPIKITLEKEAG